MTVSDYIKGKFQTFGITVSVAMAGFIPSLLLRANSIDENGFSVSWNVEGIKQYYAFLCKKYGLKDDINADKATVTFL